MDNSSPAVAAPIASTAKILREAIERANETMPGITVPASNGDNLAIALCTYFDDGEEPDDETTWSAAATEGYEQMIAAIREHYSGAIDAALAKAASI